MQTLWNRLIDLHEAMREGWTADSPEKSVKAQAYKDLLGSQGHVYLACRDEGERLGLSAWQKWHVHDTFQAAMRAWRTHQRQAPHKHHGLRDIIVPYRTQSGGVPLDWLSHDSADKHTAILPADGGHHHRRAYTTIGGVRIPLLVLLHRPLPADALIKRVALVGHHEPSLRRGQDAGWQWKFQVSLELPPPAQAPPPTGRVAGIDLGWRVWDYGLRVAVISDGQGHHWELALPWDMANRGLRRRQAWHMRDGTPLDTTGSWRQMWTWKTAIDQALEACKETLEACDHATWPAEAQQIWAGHVKMRAGGLRRLRRTLWQAGMTVQALDEWHVWHSTQMRRYRGAEIRLTRTRNHLYRLVADWLSRHYDIVSVEGDLDLQELAQKPTKTRKQRGQEGKTDRLSNEQRRERRANKNRQLASVSTLRRYLAEALAKHGRVLHAVPAAHTSRRCATCGAQMVEGAEVWRICPHGHVQDRDCTAADNLVRAIPGEERGTGGPAPAIDREQLIPILRPISATGATLGEDVRVGITPTTWRDDEADDIADVAVPASVLATVSQRATVGAKPVQLSLW
jgi:hypothetical protein